MRQTEESWEASGACRSGSVFLRQVLEWRSAVPTQAHMYVFENPQVFEEVSALVSCQSDSVPGRSRPSLVCTSGWPSVAALKLLQMFVDQSPDNRLYYSSDFDLKGLQIAASLMARYVGRGLPWRFDVASYLVARPRRKSRGERQLRWPD